jgi:hypothetical protein
VFISVCVILDCGCRVQFFHIDHLRRYFDGLMSLQSKMQERIQFTISPLDLGALDDTTKNTDDEVCFPMCVHVRVTDSDAGLPHPSGTDRVR